MIRRVGALLIVLCIVVSATTPASAAAKESTARKARKEEIKRELSNLKEQVAEVSAEEADLLGKLDDVHNRRAELDDEVAALDERIDEVQESVDAAAERFNELSAELVGAQLKLDIARDEEIAARNNLRDRAVEAYMHTPQLTAAGMMMHADTPRQVAASKGYYKAIINDRKVALDKYSALKDSTEALRGGVEDKRDEAKKQQDVIVAERRKLEDVRNERESVRLQVLAQEDQQEKLLGEIQARKAEFQSQIALLQAESSAITSFLQGVQVGQVAIPAGSGRLGVPIPGARVSSPFGPRMHPIFNEMRMHTGMDFSATSGTPIRAAADGVVVFAGARGGYGNATVLDHGASLATLTAHQSAIFVTSGQRVLRGQVIGAVGCTGYCTGPHLHFEVRVNGTPVNPLLYF